MGLSKRRYPFFISILTLFLITLGCLSAALIYIGDRTSTALRIQSVAAQVSAAEHGVEQFTKTRLEVISKIHKTVMALPASDREKLVSGETIEDLLPALVPMHRALPSIVSTLIGFNDGDFFYFSDVDHLDKDLEIVDRVPEDAAFIVLTIQNGAETGNARWWFYNADLQRIGGEDIAKIEYDPRRREWYQLAQTEKHSLLTQPYVFAGSGKVGVTFSTPMPDGGGVIGLHFSIEDIATALAGFEVSESSVAFIVGENHQVIHHPTLSAAVRTAEGVLRPATLSDYDDPIISAVTTHIEEGTIGEVFQIEVKGEKFITYVGELKSSEGFRFFSALAVPENSLTNEIDAMREQASLVVLAVILVSILFVLFIASFISKPIKRLGIMAEHIADLDLDSDKYVDSHVKEVAILSDTMERMRSSLGTFGQYVPRQLVKRILANPHVADLGGQRREVTAMFSDVRGFTNASDKLEPEEILPLISDYFQVMTDCVMTHKGIVDKFIGDAVMAIWNTPDDDPDHAVNACRTALMAKVKLEEFNENYLAVRNIEPFFTRIGLNTGICVAGNVGSDDRKDYTIFGPMVNMAARLEALNKDYGTQILVSEFVYEKVKNKFDFRHVDQVVPKGASKPMDVYELLGEKV